MQTKIEKQINSKLEKIEKRIKSLQGIVLFGTASKLKKPVSFRGIAKTSLSENQLDKAIQEAKDSLFPHKKFYIARKQDG